MDLAPKLAAWFGANDSSTAELAYWDVNAAVLAEAVLFCMSEGMSVWFSTTRDGGSVCVTFVEGEAKFRKYAADSIELDDIMHLVVKRRPPRQVIPVAAD